MSRRNLRTASVNKSIWLDLPEDIFRQHLVSLEERTNAVPIDPQAFLLEEWLPTSPYMSTTTHTLPLEIEQKLADDFASLVAVEEGAQSVAAVCIEECIHPPKLTLRFAALDISLNAGVQSTLQSASDVLAQISSDTGDNMSLTCHIDALFHLVTQLHFRRLLARLRSVKWEKPKFLSRSHKKPLWQDFSNLIHRVQFLYTKRERSERQVVERILSEMASVYEKFEAVTSQAEFLSLVQLVDASFTFCSAPEIKEYTERLHKSLGPTPTKQTASAMKCLRQVQKIAAYRRICISLVETAQRFPRLFDSGVAVDYLKPYKSIPTSFGYEEWATTCHVHAEVQLAVYYDLQAQLEPDQKTLLQPRCIGISKWLCYLCYQFLCAHKQFFPSRTHGRLYDQWTVPDLKEFDENLCRRYRGILKEIDGKIVQQTENEPELWRIEPMTSMEIYRT